MDRIALTRTDLEITIGVWIATAGIQRPAAIRDLWTRKDEPRDVAKREAARHALAEFIAGRMAMSGWEVTRRAGLADYSGLDITSLR